MDDQPEEISDADSSGRAVQIFAEMLGLVYHKFMILSLTYNARPVRLCA